MSELRAQIAAAVAHHEANPSRPSSLPPNRNQLGRPPSGDMTNLSPSDAQAMRHLLPRMALRLQEGHVVDPEKFNEMELDLRQFRRAENNDRAVPGEYMGDPSLPHIPLPFAARETHRPDRLPGSPAHAAMQRAVADIDAHQAIEGIADKMGTREKVAAIEAREDASEPTLRERVEASVAVHTQEN